MLSALELRVDGEPAEHLATATSLDDVRFSYLLRGLDQLPVAADPALRLDRRRRVRPGLVDEKLTVTSVLAEPIQLGLSLRFEADLAPVEAIKVGDLRPARALTGTGHGGSWTDGTVTATLTADASADFDAPVVAVGTDDLTVSWTISVPARGVATVGWQVALVDTGGGGPSGPPWRAGGRADRARPGVGGSGGRRRSEASALGRAGVRGSGRTPDDDDREPEHPFYAAGAPWYFTLFGRDSILSARMMLAVDPAMAAGTLRDPGSAAGQPRSIQPRRSSPARSCTSCAAAPSPSATSRCRPSTTAPSTPPLMDLPAARPVEIRGATRGSSPACSRPCSGPWSG